MYSPAHVEIESAINQVCEAYKAGDKNALDNIYDVLMPFSLHVCSRTCGRYIHDEDEEASIARLAILEALEKYQADKGSFFIFLGHIIRSRIIDFKRKEKKQGIIPFKFLSKNGSSLSEKIDDRFFEGIIDDLARQQEIKKLKEMLLDFDICFEELVQVSPRQPKSRENAHKIACLIAEQEELKAYLLAKKQLPLKELESNWQINRKAADRYRKYIITAVLINIYDFPYLQGYLLPVQGVNNNGS